MVSTDLKNISQIGSFPQVENKKYLNHQPGYDSIYTYRIQMTHILEDLTDKMKGQPHKKEVSWVLGIHFLYTLENDHGTQNMKVWFK